MISIGLVDHMGSDLTVVNAARVSFSKSKENIDGGDVKLIQYLARHRHTTPFRHPQVSLRCKAPIFLARQLGKHQVGMSWNEVSRRYVDSEPEFFTPTVWRARPEGGIKQGSGAEVSSPGTVGVMAKEAEKVAIASYKKMLQAGVAPELARTVLPQSMLTEWIWTGSLMSFAHVYNERSDEHAQVEAREFASLLDGIMVELFPHSWSVLT